MQEQYAKSKAKMNILEKETGEAVTEELQLLELQYANLPYNSKDSSLRGQICEKDAVKLFAKFTEKHLCLSLFFDKAADLQPNTSVFL